MDNRSGLVGWTDEKWNRIRQAVSEEAHKARVAAKFLPPYGPLPPSTQVVPSELFNRTTEQVNDVFTAPLMEVYEDVVLSRQQVNEEDLSSALLSFRRAANDVANVEDQIIFKGLHDYRATAGGSPTRRQLRVANTDQYQNIVTGVIVYGRVGVKGGEIDGFELGFFNNQVPPIFGRGAPASAAASAQLRDRFHHARLMATNPGALGLLQGSSNPLQRIRARNPVADILAAVTTLEANGYLAPFVCVLGQRAFVNTHTPIGATAVSPSNLIEPILGSQIMRSSAIPSVVGDSQGLVLSLAGDPIDLALAVDASPQFTNINGQGQYSFRVVESFALRVKDPAAIVRLQF